MTIEQGEVYWVDLPLPLGAEPGYRRPCVIVQNDILNDSPLRTTVISLMTSNPRRGAVRGNVALDAGEGGLPRASVVTVDQLYTIDKAALRERLGKLSHRRVREITAGISRVVSPARL